MRGEAFEETRLVHRIDLEENDGAVAEDHGAAGSPGFERERIGGKAAGLAKRAGVDVDADGDGSQPDALEVMEQFRAWLIRWHGSI